MSLRIENLNRIKDKVDIKPESDKFYDEIYSDLDLILFELHSTIEHVRISSMITNIHQDENTNEKVSKVENYENFDNTQQSQIFSISNIDEKITEVAIICREFVTSSKSMISSALVDEISLKPHIRAAMNALGTLVAQCFETCFSYLYRNQKLDETRQLLIQILNLLNTFRTTLNITYLAASKKLNETNIDLLMKQAASLANEISLLIKHFKLIF